ncbi:MAG: YqhG family protein [Vulcanibacillus sp.]
MDQLWVKDYLKQYFLENECQIVEEGLGHIEVKLSKEVDKDLTNRPYYWTFVERTGTEPETLTLNFILDSEKTPKDKRGEEINFGSERLKSIFNSTKKRGKVVRLYQQSSSNNNYNVPHSFTPWLGVNYKIEFISDKKKDKIISLGINLGTGEMKEDFIVYLKSLNLGPVLPPNTPVISTFIRFREAALQLEERIMLEISKENFIWANDAYTKLLEEIEQLEGYYTNIKFNNEDNVEDRNSLVEKEKKIDEVKWQYSPRINVSTINYGLFYLE